MARYKFITITFKNFRFLIDLHVLRCPEHDFTISRKCLPVLIELLLLFGTRAYLFSPEERSCYVFRPETIVASFLHSMVLIPKVLFNQDLQYFFEAAFFQSRIFSSCSTRKYFEQKGLEKCALYMYL